MSPITHRFLVVLASALLSSSVHADQVDLDNGVALTGTVESIQNGTLTLATDYAGTLSIDMARVTRLITDGNYDVTLKSGESVSGKLAADGIDSDGAVIPATLGNITTLAPPPSDAPVWTSRLDAFASLSNGNSETETFNLISDSSYLHGNNEHYLTATWGKEEADGVTTRDQIEVAYNYNRFLQNDWYLNGNLAWFKDELKDIDRRITVGVGIGRVFWDNPLGRLSAELGISQVFEDLNGDGENNPALRWALRYNRFLATGLEVFHDQEILKILGSGRGEIYDTTTGLRYALSDQLSVSLRAHLRHETDPPEGRHQSDITYGVGVGYVF